VLADVLLDYINESIQAGVSLFPALSQFRDLTVHPI
jgi:hypothetical protein